ncbi:tetraspanin-8-like [Vitis vinifera]|uniref:tetraspanin-8-like n=1 Tax=Vitis vinifera TaxID=29760 RepID=UPI0008FEB954|nr:tetraspanin-8-like [Vitis vinifera]|eukprot:XP_019071877.1 PREDICTED: tetraspanin-8-like [Vitis vinifera]
MVHFSNVLIAILNILTMLIVVASLAVGIYFHILGETHCQKFLQTPLLVLGAFLFMVSLCELVGSTCKLQNHLANDKNWGRIKSCLMDTDICSRLKKEINDNVVAFYRKNLSAIQSSCYKPPTYCGFEFKNATLWVLPMPRNGDRWRWCPEVPPVKALMACGLLPSQSGNRMDDVVSQNRLAMLAPSCSV